MGAGVAPAGYTTVLKLDLVAGEEVIADNYLLVLHCYTGRAVPCQLEETQEGRIDYRTIGKIAVAVELVLERGQSSQSFADAGLHNLLDTGAKLAGMPQEHTADGPQ